ncbi:MAG: ABC transporter ATP-binding protein [Spirochaetales bacterium]|nr:ABC transporter ATP-binding protein [Spirochaetales bacterium]
MKPVIEIKDLVFQYGKEALFDELSLSVGPGLYGLLGKNGAGKSTLLKIISGQLFPHSGSCLTAGEVPGKRKPEMLSEVFYLPEEITVPEIKGNMYVDLNAPFYPRFDRKQFEGFLELFEVPGNKKLTTLSYGQKKKFLIAFAASTGCPLILLDEPTNGLDIPSKSQFRQVAASMDLDNQTMLISTHQVRDMEMLIDPVIIVDNGKIIMNSSMEDVMKAYHVEFTSEEPAPEEALYSEKVLGGWNVARKGPSPDASAIDLEFLFNLTIKKGGLK